MFSNDVQVAAGIIVLVAWPLLWFASLSVYRIFFGPELAAAWTLGRRVVLALVSFAAGWAMVMSRLDDLTPGGIRFGDLLGVRARSFKYAFEFRNVSGGSSVFTMVAQIGSAGIAVVLAIALGVKLYEKWINGRLSEAERRPGAEGVRAWLSGANVLMILGIGVSVWLTMLRADAVPMTVLGMLLIGGVLAAYPLIAGASVTSEKAGAGTREAGLTPERERVLRMVEEGKVTAEEGAELLNALGATLPPAAPAEPWTPGRKLMAIGAAVVLVGFFLPWFAIDLGQEMRQMVDGTMGAMPQGMGMDLRRMVPSVPTVRVAGGDVRYGLGWIVLGLGVGAGLVPVLLPSMAREQRRGIMTGALAAGAIILLYLLTGNLSRLSFGLPVVMVGYAVEVAGLLRDQYAWGVSAPLRAAPRAA